jgi:enamine deaminase RidA (YjgF/YER057c/UK114 family)
MARPRNSMLWSVPMTRVADRLRDQGIDLLPYTPLPPGTPRLKTLIVSDMLYVSGHGPNTPGVASILGKVGRDLDVAEARLAAARAALNILTTIEHEVGLDRVLQLVKVLGMVSSAEGFTDQPAVIDGASDMFLAAFGDQAGLHTRSAVGLAELPGGMPVELELQAVLRS